MTQRLSFFTSLIMIGALLSGLHFTLQAVAQNPDAARTGVILEVDGPIGPAIAEYFEEQIVEANASGADLVIVEMDTPGGLDTSMRQMIKAITASDTPVATFVTPAGARAASAGLYIMYASHIAAMSPGTNTGAATPVQVGGAPPSPEPGSNPFEAEEPAAGDGETPADDEASEDPTADGEAAAETEETATEETPALGNEDALRAKVINDAAAYIRSLADLRGRNADWGERAVRDAASLAANEALELNVIDVVATDIPDLLAQIDGRTIDINGEAVVLETEDMQLTRVEPDLLTRILAFISNPNVALIFMTIGTYGIIIEMWNPGSIFPGALGVASLVIGLYSFQVLSVNWMGAALMGLGVILIVVEAFAPSFGLIGLSGLTLFVIGAYLLFPGDAPGFEVSPVVIGTLAAFGAVFLGSILVAITRSRSHGPVIGIEAIRKREGFVDEWDNGTGTGHVIVEGERWAARCDKALEPGQRIRVLEVDGLVLVVKPVKG